MLWYQQGRISQEWAANIAGLGRTDFLLELANMTAQAIRATAWPIIKPIAEIPIAITEWRLGAGESAVLALAATHQMEAIIDDLAGRKCAASLNIPVRGTLGIVLAAKQRDMIPQAKPVIEDMMNAGLYLSRQVLNQALQRVGE